MIGLGSSEERCTDAVVTFYQLVVLPVILYIHVVYVLTEIRGVSSHIVSRLGLCCGVNCPILSLLIFLSLYFSSLCSHTFHSKPKLHLKST